MAKLEVTLESLIAPAVEMVGFELWGIEFIRAGKHSTLSVYIDSPDGVTVDGCAEVSHHISAIMDVEDPISSEYTLEVSSPGMDRRLFKLAQYELYMGGVINIKTRLPVDGRRKFKGVLEGVEGDNIVVSLDNSEFVIPFKNIDKAQIVPQF
ncbi:ribosome maturation factor RimP [Catenovulum sp. SM1970]|uniref:ribosome maturation factor RimP n=1 Tax=Marinifaba aquimaris TaxID=2741323 RepID=UPI001573701A|nr:ribosome maturation factor RimP [Marinifaba aquimaris]NTS77925.1 ribosome maturation factor RimP [Marinifaba aquimaris]